MGTQDKGLKTGTVWGKLGCLVTLNIELRSPASVKEIPPRIKQEEMEDIKKYFNLMTEELSTVAKQQTKLVDLLEEVKRLKSIMEGKDKKTE